jgi:hypothetical protein
MKPFRNKGWPWLRYMETLLPGPSVSGSYIFAPSQSTAAPVCGEDEEDELEAGTTSQIAGPSTFSRMDVDTVEHPISSSAKRPRTDSHDSTIPSPSIASRRRTVPSPDILKS